MARLIAKFDYMKSNKRNRSGFVDYIAKRDGVIKNIKKSKQLILPLNLLHTSKSLRLKNYPTFMNTIDTSHRDHGLLKKELMVSLVFMMNHLYLIILKTEVQNHPSNIWTGMIPLKRDDTSRLSYIDLNHWKSLFRSKIE